MEHGKDQRNQRDTRGEYGPQNQMTVTHGDSQGSERRTILCIYGMAEKLFILVGILTAGAGGNPDRY